MTLPPSVPLELGQRLCKYLGAQRIEPTINRDGRTEYSFFMRDSASRQPERYIASSSGNVLRIRTDGVARTLEFHGSGYRLLSGSFPMDVVRDSLDGRIALRADDGTEYGFRSGAIVYASPAMRNALILKRNEDE